MHQGHWHGDVAVKVLDMDNVEDDSARSATLEAFRLDVATFRKTRHENVILFMGACMNPPKLAIVTSLCKGKQQIFSCRRSQGSSRSQFYSRSFFKIVGFSCVL